MLKKFLLVFLLAFFAASPTYAHDSTSATNSSKTSTRESIKALRQEQKEEIAQRREAFKEQVTKIKDEAKKEIVERIYNKIADINTKQTEQMNTVLQRLTVILTHIEERTQIAETNGENTTAVKAAITSAKSALTTAQSKIDEQAAKTYTATITTDNALRNVIGNMVVRFRTDMTNTRKYVLDARESVVQARRELMKLKGENNSSATSSAIVQ